MNEQELRKRLNSLYDLDAKLAIKYRDLSLCLTRPGFDHAVIKSLMEKISSERLEVDRQIELVQSKAVGSGV